MAKTGGRMFRIVLGAIAFVACMVVVRQFLNLPSSVGYGVSAAVGGTLLLSALRVPSASGQSVELHYAWENLRKVTYDHSMHCLVLVFKGKKPKGGLYVVQPPNSPLEHSLKERLQARRR